MESCEHCGSAACVLFSDKFCRHMSKLRGEEKTIVEIKSEHHERQERRNNGKNHKARRR